jgi:hypothetical protein
MQVKGLLTLAACWEVKRNLVAHWVADYDTLAQYTIRQRGVSLYSMSDFDWVSLIMQLLYMAQ